MRLIEILLKIWEQHKSAVATTAFFSLLALWLFVTLSPMWFNRLVRWGALLLLVFSIPFSDEIFGLVGSIFPKEEAYLIAAKGGVVPSPAASPGKEEDFFRGGWFVFHCVIVLGLVVCEAFTVRSEKSSSP
jgi:hypothetical protein